MRAGLASRHPGPVVNGRSLRPTCAKNYGFVIRAKPATWEAAVPKSPYRVKGHYRVMKLKDVVSSDDPAYAVHKDWQNRIGENKLAEASLQQIKDAFYWKAYGDSAFTDTGAPIVLFAEDAEGKLRPFVVSGNGRMMVLKSLLADHMYDRYRGGLKEMAAAMGLEVPEDGEEYVLVRVIDDLGGISIGEFVTKSNGDNKRKVGDAARAKQDAATIVANGLAALYRANADGTPDMTPGVNDEFFRLFSQRATDGDAIYDENFNVVEEGKNRVMRALLYVSCGQGDRGPETVDKVILMTDTLGIRRQRNAMECCAAPVAALEQNPDYAIGPDVSRAMADYMDFVEKKRAGKVVTFDEYLGEQDMFDRRSEIADGVLRLLGSGKNAREIADVVKAYCDVASKSEKDGGLMGAAAARTREDVWREVTKAADEAQKGGRQADNSKGGGSESRLSVALAKAGEKPDGEQMKRLEARYALAAATEVTLSGKDIALAVSKWGTTDDLNKAIYCLPDGMMLMGRGVVMNFGDERIESFGHDGWTDLVRQKMPKVKKTGLAGMAEASGQIQAAKRAIARTGAIRISGEKDGFTVSREPTAAQYDALYDMIEKAYQIMEENGDDKMMIDVADENLDTLFTLTYPRGTSARRIVDDLRGWYERGEKPGEREQSLVAMFHAGDNRWSIAPQGVQKGAGVEYPDAADELRVMDDAALDARWSIGDDNIRVDHKWVDGQQRWSVAELQSQRPYLNANQATDEAFSGSGNAGSYHFPKSGVVAARQSLDKLARIISNRPKAAQGVFGSLRTALKNIEDGKPVFVGGRKLSAKNFVTSMQALGFSRKAGANSAYLVIGEDSAVRASDHSANAELFVQDGTDNNLSVVIRRPGHAKKFVPDNSANVVEAVFTRRDLDEHPEKLPYIVRDIAEFIATGEYHDTAGAMAYNYSGSDEYQAAVRDRIHADAIARGDMAAAARMVREAAKSNGFDSEKIKSAAPATYDDAGKLIPLSQRFDQSKADVRWSIGARRRAEFRELMRRKRPDIAAEDVEAYLDEIAGYESAKKQKLAVHWLITGAIELPEDAYKLDKAIATAERAKVDPFQYRNPEDIFAAFPQHLPKDPAIDPDTVPELTGKVDMGHGITVYDVQDDREGQAAMRRIINTHFGKDASPWCLLQGEGDTGELSDQAWHYWQHYNALPKKVAFLNGRLLAFMATDRNVTDDVLGLYVDLRNMFPSESDEYDEWLETDEGQEEQASFLKWMSVNHHELLLRDELVKRIPEQWWDRKDASHDGIPIEGKIAGDPLGRSGLRELKDGELKLVGRTWKGDRKNGMYEEWEGEQKALEEERKDGRMVGWRRTYRNGELSTVEHYNEKCEHDRPKLEFYPGLGLAGYVEFGERDIPTLNVTFRTDGTLRSYGRHESPDGLAKTAVSTMSDGTNVSWTDDAGDYYSIFKDRNGIIDHRFAYMFAKGEYDKKAVDLSDASLRAKLEGESAAVLEAVKAEAAAIYREYSAVAGAVQAGARVMDDAAQDARWSIGQLYTGSAADYAKPSLLKVGTGEGSQVYGWGLYASSERGVAEGYASRDERTKYTFDGKPFADAKRYGHDYTFNGSVLHGKDKLRAFVAEVLVEQGGKEGALKFLNETNLPMKKSAIAEIEKNAERYGSGNGNIYEQTFFTNRAPSDESHLLSWYEPVSKENIERIRKQLEQEKRLTDNEWLLDDAENDYREYRSDEVYKHLSRTLGSPQAASEFLARADIDGIKYPVDSYGGKTVKDGDLAGWNYVSFRDDNIRVDHKWVDGQQRWSIAAGDNLSNPEKADVFVSALKAYEGSKPPARLRKSDPQSAYAWFKDNLLGKTFQLGGRSFTVKEGHFFRFVCEEPKDGRRKGWIDKATSPDESRSMIESGEVSAEDIAGYVPARAASLPFALDVLTSPDAIIRRPFNKTFKDTVIKKFNTGSKTNDLAVFILNDDGKTLGLETVHRRQITKGFVNGNNLIAISNEVVESRSPNPAGSRLSLADNAGDTSANYGNSIPNSAAADNPLAAIANARTTREVEAAARMSFSARLADGDEGAAERA